MSDPNEPVTVSFEIDQGWAVTTITQDADTGNTISAETAYNSPETWESTWPEDD